MLFVSSILMALAWLGHLKFKEYSFPVALMGSWLLVFPEYVLNISAIRYGHGTFTGSQMATFHLCFGVVCVALVSRFYLGEPIRAPQFLGFVLLAVAMFLISYDPGQMTIPVAGVMEADVQ